MIEQRVERLKNKIDEVFDALESFDDSDEYIDLLSDARERLHSAANQISRAEYGDAIRSRRAPINFDGDEDGYDELELSF